MKKLIWIENVMKRQDTKETVIKDENIIKNIKKWYTKN